MRQRGADFTENFIDRVQGLAKTHDILSANDWSDVTLAELIGAELNAFVANGDRACFAGPDVHLRPKATTTLGMVIHELATNAVKYGALGETGGRVRVDWDFQDQVLVVTWQESGGPPVRPPKRTGLGTDLIERSLDYEMGGKAAMDYRPDGIVVTLTIPAAKQHMNGEAQK